MAARLASKLLADVCAAFQRLKARAELKCGKPVKRFRSDNGGEYTSIVFQTTLQSTTSLSNGRAPICYRPTASLKGSTVPLWRPRLP